MLIESWPKHVVRCKFLRNRFGGFPGTVNVENQRANIERAAKAWDADNSGLDLTQRIQEFRAGKMASALPNGKSTVKLRDVTNTAHDELDNISVDQG